MNSKEATLTELQRKSQVLNKLELQFPIETTGEKLMFVNKEGLSGFPYKVIS